MHMCACTKRGGEEGNMLKLGFIHSKIILRQITFYLYFLIFLASIVAFVVHFLNCDFVVVFCLFITHM